jgi:hypothetical protein
VLSLTAHRQVTGPIVLAVFRATVAAHGAPASTLTDIQDGMMFTTWLSGGRSGRNAFEHELRALGIKQKNGRPNHPRPKARWNGSSGSPGAVHPDRSAGCAGCRGLL